MSDLHPLTVHLRVTVLRSGGVRRESFVRCELRDEWIGVETCRNCDRCAHVSVPSSGHAGVVVCSAPEYAGPDSAGAHLDPIFVCVESGATAGSARAVMATEAKRVAVVVDLDGHPIGLVDVEALASVPPETPIDKLAEFAVATLLEGASYQEAERLTHEFKLHGVAVVRQGKTLGLVARRS